MAETEAEVVDKNGNSGGDENKGMPLWPLIPLGILGAGLTWYFFIKNPETRAATPTPINYFLATQNAVNTQATPSSDLLTPTPYVFITPLGPNQIRNPLTGVIYTIDEIGCAIIPAGGTAYGAATVLGNPSDPLDISLLVHIKKNGTRGSTVTRPNDLPSLTHPGDRVCSANSISNLSSPNIKGVGKIASRRASFHPDFNSSKPTINNKQLSYR